MQAIAGALTPVLGERVGRVAFALGVSGASLVAAIVVTLTAARSLGELFGYRHSLEHSLRSALVLYGLCSHPDLERGHSPSGANLVTLSVGVQVMNVLLLPVVLGFLFLLARRLPPPFKLAGGRTVLAVAVMIVTVALRLYAGVAGLWG